MKPYEYLLGLEEGTLKVMLLEYFSFVPMFVIMLFVIAAAISTLFSKILSKEDLLFHFARGGVIFIASLIALSNVIAYLASPHIAVAIAYPILVIFFAVLSYSRKKHEDVPLDDKKIKIMIVAGLICVFYHVFSLDIDYNHFNFGLIKSISEGVFPPRAPFSPDELIGYHYGPHLIISAFVKFGMSAHVAVDLFFIFTYSYSLIFIWKILEMIQVTKPYAVLIGLLVWVGCNIRFLVICLEKLIVYKEISDYKIPEVMKHIHNDYSLHAQIFQQIREDWSFLPSSIGLPITLLMILLCVNYLKQRNVVCLYLSIPLIIANALCREDFLLTSLVSIFFYILVTEKKLLINKHFVVVTVTCCLFVLFQGGVATEVFLDRDSIIESKNKQVPEAYIEVIDNPVEMNLSLVPKLSSWRMYRGKAKFPVWHPVILLDLFLDTAGLFLLFPVGLFFLFKHRHFEMERMMFIFISISSFFFFFVIWENENKVALQRILPYSLFLFTCVYAAIYFKWTFLLKRNTLVLLMLTNILYFLKYPVSMSFLNKLHNSELHQIGDVISDDIEVDAQNFSGRIWGLNPGYTGYSSISYNQLGGFNKIQQKCFENFDATSLDQLKIKYLVFDVATQSQHIERFYEDKLWSCLFKGREYVVFALEKS